MTAPWSQARRQSPWDDPRLIFPDEATWEGLTPTQKEAVIERIVAALDEYQEAMSEGTRHFRRKVGIAAELDAHFRRAGRAVYVGSELAVLSTQQACDRARRARRDRTRHIDRHSVIAQNHYELEVPIERKRLR